ncbi:MAG: hypothetical protein RIT33_89, partial [Pseudomonadota bacterium]
MPQTKLLLSLKDTGLKNTSYK